MREPLYSTNNLPIYGNLTLPVYADGVLQSDQINIVFEWTAYPDLDVAVGFTGETGVGWRVHAGSTAEMAALDWVSWDNTTYGPELVDVDVALMISGECGKGNDGTNDYYDIRIAAGWYTSGATGESCIIRAIYGAYTDEVTITGLVNNGGKPTNTHVATLRWTPATSTLEFI